MSIFQRLRDKRESHCDRRSAEQLAKGVKYPVFKFSQRLSDYPDRITKEKPMNLIVHYLDDNFKYYIIMPSFYNNLSSTEVAELNGSIKPNSEPFIVYYGKDGTRNEVVLHEAGENVDEKKLAQFAQIENAVKKRKLTESFESSGSGNSPQ